MSAGKYQVMLSCGDTHGNMLGLSTW